jgi:hypothetical protein
MPVAAVEMCLDQKHDAASKGSLSPKQADFALAQYHQKFRHAGAGASMPSGHQRSFIGHLQRAYLNTVAGGEKVGRLYSTSSGMNFATFASTCSPSTSTYS